jgi:hypothetical protein
MIFLQRQSVFNREWQFIPLLAARYIDRQEERLLINDLHKAISSWEATSSSASQQFTRILRRPNVRYRERGSAVGWATALKAGRSRVRFMMGSQIFHWFNPANLTMVLRSTQPLTEISTRDFLLEGKGDRCLGLTTLPPSCTGFLKNREASNSWRFWCTSRPVQKQVQVNTFTFITQLL